MKSNFVASLLIFWALLFSCENQKDTAPEQILVGNWKAAWDTSPASFPEVKDISVFSMNGNFEFQENGQVTVTAFGFPGCIFSTDTLSHSLQWVLRNDTLSLVNEGDIYGMTYQVKSLSNSRVDLQLMDDISVTLTKGD